MNITIRFLIKYTVRQCTLYYTFNYNSALYRSKKRNLQICWPRSSQQDKDHVGLKKLSLRVLLNYIQSLYQFV